MDMNNGYFVKRCKSENICRPVVLKIGNFCRSYVKTFAFIPKGHHSIIAGALAIKRIKSSIPFSTYRSKKTYN
jgi:hypothetical protein